ncbi:MAG: DUF554 domain-containing protein [Clostridia bacterium]|nr:DUF554 domain-containing protein [Clostridia bacterium]
MTGIGTIVNVIAVMAGSFVGLFAKKLISDRLREGIMAALGLAVFTIGLSGIVTNSIFVSGSSLSSEFTLLMILALAIGTLIGTLIDIEKRLDDLGRFFQEKLTKNQSGSTFAEGFVSASLLFCVGSMAIVGSLNDGISHDPNILFAKSILDGIMAVVFASTLGVGTMMSCLSLVVYQGGITLCASLVAPYLTDTVISQMGLIGNVLIMAIGLNFVYKPKFKVGNMLPSVFIPFIYYLFKMIFNF